jgi:hypothetical protein
MRVPDRDFPRAKHQDLYQERLPMTLKTFSTAAAIALTLALPSAALSVSVTYLEGEDTWFIPEGFTTLAEAEGRAGNLGFAGDQEFVLQSGGNFMQAQYDWGTGMGFALSYSAATTTLTFGLPGASPESLAIATDLSAANAILLRLGRGGTHSLTMSNLTFNGAALNPASVSTNTDNNLGNFLYLTGLNSTADWSITGFADLTGGRGSQPAFQFKIGEAPVAPIPLPAAAWLLIGGLGALGAVARRQRKAA